MPIVFKEKPESGAFGVDSRGARLTLLYWARGSDDPTEIYDHAILNTDSVKYGLIRTEVKAPRKQGTSYWEVDIEYGDPTGAGAGSGGTPVGEDPSTITSLPPGNEALDPTSQGMEFAFDCTTGTQHITKSLAVVASIGMNGDTPPDRNGAIGATADGRVSGCDIEAGSTEFTITVSKAVVTLDTLKQYAALATPSPHTNNADWGPFLKGEVLYRGFNAQGTQRGKWTFTHRFKFAPTLTDVSVFSYEPWLPNTVYGVGEEVENGGDRYRCVTTGVSASSGGPVGAGNGITDGSVEWDFVGDGTGITIPKVEGHNYVDVAYAPDPATGLSVPIAAYVHRVYERGDFTDLELGV